MARPMCPPTPVTPGRALSSSEALDAIRRTSSLEVPAIESHWTSRVLSGSVGTTGRFPTSWDPAARPSTPTTAGHQGEGPAGAGAIERALVVGAARPAAGGSLRGAASRGSRSCTSTGVTERPTSRPITRASTRDQNSGVKKEPPTPGTNSVGMRASTIISEARNMGVRTLRTTDTSRDRSVASVSVASVTRGRRRWAWTSSTMSPTITDIPRIMPTRTARFNVASCA